ncbi:hypothetical protein TrST_g14098 [Triparma strigata]|uniref:IQ motif and ubiquitin-like domain-containing protein n=1 Tax=Triparma strigata TaxID=1606541 RepID=A0A9W7ABX7_9STRA|nr:hypothetical protein TrST_g14098 [Triparma strigata]
MPSENQEGDGFLPPIATAEPAFPAYADPSYVMPNEISVSAQLDDGTKSTFNVTIEKLPQEAVKPYYGGYRHKHTGVTYHHSAAQTERVAKVYKDVSNLRNRDTQTYSVITKSTQLVREAGTQMKRKDLHLDESGNVSIEAKPYFSSNQLLELQRQKTLTIQCYWRGYIARKLAWARRDQIYQAHLARIKAKEDVVKENSAKQKREIERRMNPKSVKDFEILFNELETWRQTEHHKIRESNETDANKKLLVADLLAKEAKLLQTIDKLKAKALKSGREKRVSQMIQRMSEPKAWEQSDGIPIEVETPYTTRAKELAQLYTSLKTTLISTDERLDVLLNIKWTVNEFDCALTRDIVELIDREADLLNRGRGESTLSGLRVRLNNLFLQFIETPEFNPEASRFLKVPNGYEVEPLFKTLAAPSNWN